MRDGDEVFHRAAVQRIDVGLIVEPGAGSGIFGVSIPFLPARRRVGRNAAIAQQAAGFVEFHVVCAEKVAVFFPVSAAAGRPGSQILDWAGFAVRFGGPKQVHCAEFRMAGRNAAARGAGGPAVFIVQPGEQTAAFAFMQAVFYKLHIFVGKVGRLKAGAHVDVVTAHAHAAEGFNLLIELILCNFTVPRPKRRAAIFARRVHKKGRGK